MSSATETPPHPLRVLSWNLFHGRDHPPSPELFDPVARLTRRTRRDATHVQVNRNLFGEFAGVISRAGWDIALLQECPPRWSARLGRECGADIHRSLTSRNSLLPLRSLAGALNPDLIGSNDGGSNTTLVRGTITGRGELVIARAPERRTAAFTRTSLGVLVVNIHASNDLPREAEREVLHAAQAAIDLAAGEPIVLGGDLNLRPRETDAFERLAQLGFEGRPSGGSRIDHILARGLQPEGPPRVWETEERELEWDGLRLRLSDHSPVGAAFASLAPSPRE